MQSPKNFPKLFKNTILFSLSLLLLTVSFLPISAAGEVDRTFSAAVQNGFKGGVNIIVKQADGKILVGGQFTVANNSGRVSIVRFNPDGTVDQTFNPPDLYALTNSGYLISSVFIQAMAVQTDGKILVSGTFARVNTEIGNGFLRLNTDGSIDTTFAAAGINSPSVIKVQSDNKILVFYNPSTLRLIRLNADGSRDTSFQERADRVSALEVQPDGKILVGTDSSIYRLNPNGTLDISYNSATFQFSGVSKFAILPDGKILVGGGFRAISGTTFNYLARLNADGTVDTSFNPGDIGASSTVSGLDVLPDGKIIIGGNFLSYNGVERRKNARLNSDGTLDTTYNYNPGLGNFILITAVVSAGDGKIYLGGSDPNNTFQKLVRVNTDGMRDASFDVNFSNPARLHRFSVNRTERL